MPTTAIICNGCEAHNLFPTFILGSAAAAMGDKVIVFLTPGGAPALVKGELERVEARGMPEMRELVHSLQALGGRILACDLCLEAQDLREEDLRTGVEIVGVTFFLAETQDAARTFSFQGDDFRAVGLRVLCPSLGQAASSRRAVGLKEDKNHEANTPDP